MAERRVTTKAELLVDTKQAWAALHTTLDQLSEAQLTGLQDAQGWTVKDHINHLAAWERSVPLTDADLNKPYHHFLPPEPGAGNHSPAINVIYGNTAHHFNQHLRWIKALVSSVPK